MQDITTPQERIKLKNKIIDFKDYRSKIIDTVQNLISTVGPLVINTGM